MTSIKTISVIFALALLCGCSQIVNRTAAVLAPSVAITEIPIDAAGIITQDTALTFIIKRLNTTQYGIVLEDIFNRGAKPFDYADLYIKLQEKTTQGILHRENIYIVVLRNTCAAPDSSLDIRGFFEKNYFFTSLEEAQKVSSALLALGVRQCCTEGCDEDPAVMENP